MTKRVKTYWIAYGIILVFVLVAMIFDLLDTVRPWELICFVLDVFLTYCLWRWILERPFRWPTFLQILVVLGALVEIKDMIDLWEGFTFIFVVSVIFTIPLYYGCWIYAESEKKAFNEKAHGAFQ